jgi:hypothetical protein
MEESLMRENSVEGCNWKQDIRDLKVYTVTLIVMMILIGMSGTALSYPV